MISQLLHCGIATPQTNRLIQNNQGYFESRLSVDLDTFEAIPARVRFDISASFPPLHMENTFRSKPLSIIHRRDIVASIHQYLQTDSDGEECVALKIFLQRIYHEDGVAKIAEGFRPEDLCVIGALANLAWNDVLEIETNPVFAQ